jgi:virulence-associated protein VagC
MAMPVTAKLFRNGSFQIVRLPHAFRLPAKEVNIRRDGIRIILEPLVGARWPRNFLRSIRIEDRAFKRPPQGDLPPPPRYPGA